MRVTKEIDIGRQEVEIWLDDEDFELYFGSYCKIEEVKRELNKIAQYLKNIPDKLISEMGQPSREIVGKLLKEQAERYKEL